MVEIKKVPPLSCPKCGSTYVTAYKGVIKCTEVGCKKSTTEKPKRGKKAGEPTQG
jgi:hypothetical protein